MSCCGNCDFCVEDGDGNLMCALYERLVSEFDCCPDHQSATFLIDDDWSD